MATVYQISTPSLFNNPIYKSERAKSYYPNKIRFKQDITFKQNTILNKMGEIQFGKSYTKPFVTEAI